MKVSVDKSVRVVRKLCGSATRAVSMRLFRESFVHAVVRGEAERVKVFQALYRSNELPHLSSFSCMTDSGSEAHVCNDARIYINGSEKECDVVIR